MHLSPNLRERMIVVTDLAPTVGLSRPPVGLSRPLL